MTTNQRRYIFFAFIIVFNLILKSIYSACTPYSFDEIISVKDTLLDFGIIKHEAEWDNNPPFYYYCLWVWHKIFPISEFNSRFLSVIFMSVAIGLVYLFAVRRLNESTAILSSTLLTFSNFLTYYAQEARTYALVVVLVMVSTILFFKYLEKKTYGGLIILGFVNFLLVYSHYLAAIVVFFQFFLIAVNYRQIALKSILTQSFVILLLVYLRFTKKQFLNIINYSQKEFWLKKAGFTDLLGAISELYFDGIIAFFFMLLLGVFLFGLITKKQLNPDNTVKHYVFLVGFVSIVLLFIVGVFKPIFLNRYLIFSIPFAVMAVSYQLSQYKTMGIVAAICVFCYVLVKSNIYKESGSDYRSVANLISSVKKNDDKVMINTRDNLLLFEYYYSRELFLKYKNIDSLCESQNVYGVGDVAEAERIPLKPNSIVFLIQSFHKLKARNNLLDSCLKRKSEKIYRTDFFKGIEFGVYKY